MTMNDLVVYGLDFTSSPSRKSVTGESAEWLTLAECRLTGSVLKVESLTQLNAETAGEFFEYENWLKTPGEWVLYRRQECLGCIAWEHDLSMRHEIREVGGYSHFGRQRRSDRSGNGKMQRDQQLLRTVQGKV